MVLNNVDNFLSHFFLIKVIFSKGIRSRVFRNPHSAITLIIDENHGCCDLEPSESIEETLEPN